VCAGAYSCNWLALVCFLIIFGCYTEPHWGQEACREHGYWQHARMVQRWFQIQGLNNVWQHQQIAGMWCTLFILLSVYSLWRFSQSSAWSVLISDISHAGFCCWNLFLLCTLVHDKEYIFSVTLSMHFSWQMPNTVMCIVHAPYQPILCEESVKAGVGPTDDLFHFRHITWWLLGIASHFF
jgi:hypothetical protein